MRIMATVVNPRGGRGRQSLGGKLFKKKKKKKKINLKSDFIPFFLIFLYKCIAPGQEQKTLWEQILMYSNQKYIDYIENGLLWSFNML